MTFLSFRATEETIEIAMDTLATFNNGENGVFLEKSFYIKDCNAIISIKGSLNIFAPFIVKILEKQDKFDTAKELEKYTKQALNKELAKIIKKMPGVEGTKSTLRIFSWQKGDPIYFKAEYWDTSEFVFSKSKLNINDMHDTNDTSYETVNYNDFIRENVDTIRPAINFIQKTYGEFSFEAHIFLRSIASMVNDPPETYTGGSIFTYKLGKDSSKFDKTHLFTLTPETSNRISIQDANRLFNGK